MNAKRFGCFSVSCACTAGVLVPWLTGLAPLSLFPVCLSEGLPKAVAAEVRPRTKQLHSKPPQACTRLAPLLAPDPARQLAQSFYFYSSSFVTFPKRHFWCRPHQR